MRYGSICSGIEAATTAWHHLGWEAAFFSEIEPFPSAVLNHHWPSVKNLGDFTTIKEDDYDGRIELLVGGTPCQSFSVAGLRGGLDDERGNLCLEFLKLAERTRPRWLVWENVPGVLSSWSCDKEGQILSKCRPGGNGSEWERFDRERSDFSCFLEGLSECGYGWAYRVLDAQYIRVDGLGRAVPQRRRRVFVVGYIGDWRPPAAVLFERQSLSGNPAPSRTKGQRVAGTVKGGSGERGYPDLSDGNGGGLATVAAPLNTSWAKRSPGSQAQEWDSEKGSYFVPEVSPAIKARDCKGPSSDGTGDGLPIIPEATAVRTAQTNANGIGVAEEVSHTVDQAQGQAIAQVHDMRGNGEGEVVNSLVGDHLNRPTDYTPVVSEGVQEVSPTLKAESKQQTTTGQNNICVPLAFQQNTRDEVRKMGGDGQIAGALAAEAGMKQQNYIASMTVRRLTPVECARLQGFPDNHCRIP